jgi:lipoate-protein ligase A
VQIVRRISGGGTVFHDPGNTNFSFIMRREEYHPERELDLVLCALRRLGVRAQRNARRDLLLEGAKISGTAFLLTSGSALQHGTLLLRADLQRMSRCLAVPQQDMRANAVQSVRSRVANLTGINHIQFSRELARQWSEAAGRRVEPRTVDAGLIASHPDLEACCEKHHSWDWRFGRTPSFSRVLRISPNRTPTECEFRVEKGRIKTIRLSRHGEDEPPRCVEKVLRAHLLGNPYSNEAICRVICEQAAHSAASADHRIWTRLADALRPQSDDRGG